MAWKVLVLQRRISELPTIYDSCPSHCGLQNKKVDKYCDGCPITKEDKAFEKETLKELKNSLGDDWKEWSFNSLQNQVNTVMGLEKTPPGTWDVKTKLLITTFQIERNKLQRAKDEAYNEEMKSKLNNRNRGK